MILYVLEKAYNANEGTAQKNIVAIGKSLSESLGRSDNEFSKKMDELIRTKFTNVGPAVKSFSAVSKQGTKRERGRGQRQGQGQGQGQRQGQNRGRGHSQGPGQGRI